MKKAICALVVCAFCGAAQAHEFFVIPRKIGNYKAGDVIQFDVLSTHYFMVGEEIEEPSSVNDVFVRQAGKVEKLPLTANKKRMLYETSYKMADSSPALLVGNRTGGYYCTFTDGEYADGKKADVVKANPKKTVAKSRYFAKFSKTYLNPSADDTTFSKPIGQAMEVVPQTNPADIKAGTKASFLILYNGKPLADSEISATYDGFDSKTENKYAATAKTDKKGMVTFDITKNGIWLVRASDTRKSDEKDVDETNLSAIAVFMVK